MIATTPYGGVAWDYGQYAVGMEELGFEVTYLEDCGYPMLDPSSNYRDDPEYGVDFLAESLAALSPDLGRRWHVRAPDDRRFGLSAEELAATVEEADVFLNVSGVCRLRSEYLRSQRKILIDTDPGWNHFVRFPAGLAADGADDVAAFIHHDAFFTYAENIGDGACPLPTFGLTWVPTRPPVVPDRWNPEGPGDRWTTVMTWANYTEPVVGHDGATYGAKEREFPLVESMPGEVSAHLELAAGGVQPPTDRWRSFGWSVVDSTVISRTLEDYRSYVQRSRGELSVAKNAYVATRSGWFSCRSACYLAASRPVVLQDTGFSDHLPVGDGLLSFTTTAEAIRALTAVESDYQEHAEAARALAAEHLSAERILSDLLDAAGVS